MPAKLHRLMVQECWKLTWNKWLDVKMQQHDRRAGRQISTAYMSCMYKQCIQARNEKPCGRKTAGAWQEASGRDVKCRVVPGWRRACLQRRVCGSTGNKAWFSAHALTYQAAFWEIHTPHSTVTLWHHYKHATNMHTTFMSTYLFRHMTVHTHMCHVNSSDS